MKQKTVGLALGSGGWRGLAHIGVIKSLFQNNIPIDFIAGSSIGSVVGGLYSAIGNINEVEKIVNDLNFKSILKISLQRCPDKTSLFNKKFKLFLKNIIGDINIEDLKIPYCAVASNLFTGELLAIDKGNLISAMRASIAIPLIFNPIKIDDNYLFDGGMISPIPVSIVKEMGADITIGVSLYGGIFPLNLNKKSRMSRIKAGKISRFLSLKRMAQIDLSLADIPIDLKIPNEDYAIFTQFLKNKQVINCGFQSTNDIINKIHQKIK
ncbi:MAG: patatin-like phospholipase family protein [Candidatus Shapirobacteria bacterium]|nr:patatin-like phospholipase family protein [Candidatus Shapirobacteria bacterium]